MLDLNKVHSVGFSGTQKGISSSQSFRLSLVLGMFPTIPTFHCGGCVGADTQAAQIAKSYGMEVHVYPASDVNPGKVSKVCADLASVCHKAKPALVRNKDIVTAVDFMIFTPLNETPVKRSGTWSTIRFTSRMNMPHAIVLDDRVDLYGVGSITYTD